MKSLPNGLLQDFDLWAVEGAAQNLSPFFHPGYLRARAQSYAYWVTDGGWVSAWLSWHKFGVRYAMQVAPPMWFDDSSKQASLQVYQDMLGLGAHVDFLLAPSVSSMGSFAPDNTEQIAMATVRIDLAQEEEQLLAGMHSKHRNVVRRAEREEVSVRWDLDQSDTFYDLMVQTNARSGNTSVHRAEYDKLVAHLGPQNLSIACAYNKEGVLQGGAFFLHSPEGCYYLYGASIPRPETGAVNLLQWRAMQRMRVQGVRYFDLLGIRPEPEAGSKYEGIRRFKERFGGEVQHGWLWHKQFVPWKYRYYQSLKKIQALVPRGNEA